LKRLILTAILAVAVALPCAAAPNLYGTSGLMEVPDDLTFEVGAFVPAFHTVRTGDNPNIFTVGFGVTPNLSVSGGVVTNGGTDTLLNAKYRLSPETAGRPSIVVGVVDAASELTDDPGLYILFGRNLTGAAEQIVAGPSRPLRGYLGFGTGVLKGLFVGLDWTLAPQLSGMVEFLSDDSRLNVGIRYALTNEVRVDVGVLDLDDLTFGISYNVLRF
jgi:hypothetical protein